MENWEIRRALQDKARKELEAIDKISHEKKQRLTLCEFVGGKYNGAVVSEYYVETTMCNGRHSPDESETRNRGGCVHHAVLDNVPEVEGYTSMWDGDRIRYESWDVYNMMCN